MQTKLVSHGDNVSVRSGKHAGVKGKVIRLYSKWNEGNTRVRFRVALLETTTGEVWVNFRFLEVV